jgi:hypothetical protein
MADNFIEILIALLIFGIPGAALSIRFVLRPMLREIADAIRSSRGELSQDLERRLLELEEGQRLTNEQLEHLIEAERFRDQLQSGNPRD